MLDIEFIRQHKNLVKEAARKKHVKADIDRLIEVDERRRELIGLVEEKRKNQNETASKIAETEDQNARMFLIKDSKASKEELQKEEEELKKIMKEWQLLMLQVPNIPDMSVPEGKSDEDNQQIRTWGEKPNFSFKPKSHIELMQKNDMVDFARGVKVSGFRGYFLKGDGALINFALWNFVLNFFQKGGEFTPIIPPTLVNKDAFLGTGYLPQGEEDLYKTQEESYLAGTSEVPIMSYFMDEMIQKEDLPLKFLGFSPCYRREAGSYGKDAKGLMRVHEFYKLEQVVLCEASHEESVRIHEELLKNSEDIMKILGLPYRVVINSGGDLGLGQVKKYDIEAWVPSEETYKETHSCSYFHDFQSRRLNIKYQDGKDRRYVHSLNNTAIATPRILIPLIEHYQKEDGTIVVPEALRPFLGGRDTLGSL